MALPPISIAKTSDLEIAEVDASYIIGHKVTIETNKGRRICEKAVKVWNYKLKPELTLLIDGVDTNVYVSVEDDSG